MKNSADVVIIGAGHNGLVAAALLAKEGLEVIVLEEKVQIGGATKTEYPFANAPGLGTSTGAYLLGVMPYRYHAHSSGPTLFSAHDR